MGKFRETHADGLEHHMQVNVWSQFHLAMTLLPKLHATPDSRLVLQSSELHRGMTGGVTFKNFAEVNTDAGPTVLYNRSNMAQVLLVRAMHRRKMDRKLGLVPGQASWIIATHPGAVSTDQAEQAVEAYENMAKAGVAVIRPFMKDLVDEGCRPALFTTTSRRGRITRNRTLWVGIYFVTAVAFRVTCTITDYNRVLKACGMSLRHLYMACLLACLPAAQKRRKKQLIKYITMEQHSTTLNAAETVQWKVIL